MRGGARDWKVEGGRWEKKNLWHKRRFASERVVRGVQVSWESLDCYGCWSDGLTV